MIARRTLARERRVAPNEAAGAKDRDAVGRKTGPVTTGDAATTAGGAISSTKTGSGRGATTGGGGGGVVTSGGKGCTAVRLTFGRCARGGGGAARTMTWRGRMGGGGWVPAGIPSASRKRRTRSSSLSGVWRKGGDLCSFGRGAGGVDFPESSGFWRVNNFSSNARPARTRKMTVSFISRN